ncbi:MAG: protein kinase [Acidobacteria bacterium]|nr:protein kinase [Acidobacteriota bacterium]
MIEPGTRLGRYEIRSPLGAGGMGEVYLALDTQLEREVALKILPAEIASDSQRLQRFLQEARAASKLKGERAAHIYEIGEAGGTHFIAMEYVEGETLDRVIAARPMSVADVVRVGIQIAEALDEAHARGVAHRDVKPANVVVTPRGAIKVLDFGLAKLAGGVAAGEAATRVKTNPGAVMGTVSYMSPEQAMGREVDARTDVWSLGVVLYEMATGRLPFRGESVTETIDAIAHAQPEAVARFNYDVPAELEVIIKKALRKNADERYQTARVLLIDLRALQRELEVASHPQHSAVHGSRGGAGAPASGGEQRTALLTDERRAQSTAETSAANSSAAARSTTGDAAASGGGKRPGRVAFVAFVALLIAVAGYGVYKYYGGRRKSPPSAMSITRLTTTGRATCAAVSPDGRYVVYASSDGGQQSLWMRQTATQSNVQIVAPAAVEYLRLIFSPDGDYLFYVTRADGVAPTLYQIPALGGTPKRFLANVGYMALSPDASRIVFVRDLPAEGAQALIVSNIDGTAERQLAVRKLPERAFILGGGTRVPAWSPDGKTIVCPVNNLDGGVAYSVLVAIDVASGQEKPISSQKFFAIRDVAWLADGSGLLVLAIDESGFFQTVGPGRGQIWLLSYPEGEARRITNDLNSYRTISLTADSNSFVTVQIEQKAAIWVAPQADAARARQITSGAGRVDLNVRWTPANKLVFDSNASGQAGIWTMDADGNNQRQLSESGALLAVSPDGSLIAFQSFRTGAPHIFLTDAGGGNVRQLTNGSGEYGASFSPDGKWVFYSSRAAGKLTLWRVPVEGGEPQRVTDKRSYGAQVSPDGKWLAAAYSGDQPGVDKVALIPPDGGAPVKLFDIPVGGGLQDLHWSPDSRALIYIDTRGGVSNLWQQPVEGGAPKQLTDFKADRIFWFDFSRDGRQLALSRGTVNDDVVLIKNFR